MDSGMKAIAVFPRTRELRLVDHPEPALDGPLETKIRMLEVGLCGTDKEIGRFEYGEPPPNSEYLILGHESLGEVVEVGPAASRVRPGDLVCVMVRRPCARRECAACRAGRQDFCYSGEFTERGIRGRHGFLSEFITEDEEYLAIIPRELRDVGVLVEPLTIAEKAFTQVFDIQERLPWISPAAGSEPPLTGRNGLVLGAGPVGLLGAMKMAAAGCSTTVYSREPAAGMKAALTQSLGARYVSSAETSVETLAHSTGNLDIVYEATGASKLSFDVLRVLGTNAIFIFTGVPGRKHHIEIDASLLMRNIVLKNQNILGTVNAGRDAFEAAVRDLAVFRMRFPDALSKMITRRYTMDELASIDIQSLSGIKNVVAIA
jgi:threonine dehydrogenase-like Zn-dependent dehydrogenase